MCGFQEHGADAACGYWCYDYYKYVCCNDNDTDTIYGINDAYIPCPIPYLPDRDNGTRIACGSVLCDESGYRCCDDVVNGPTCYWPGASNCADGAVGYVLCGIYDDVCNTTCYDYRNYGCSPDLKLYNLADSTHHRRTAVSDATSNVVNMANLLLLLFICVLFVSHNLF